MAAVSPEELLNRLSKGSRFPAFCCSVKTPIFATSAGRKLQTAYVAESSFAIGA